MTFTCDRDILFEAVNTVIKTVPAKSAVSVLEGIYIEVCTDKTIKLIGSDTDISTEIIFECESVTENQKMLLPAKKFYEMVSKMNSGEVYFEYEPKKILHINCGVVKYDIPVMDADLYPVIPIVERKEKIIISKSVFSDIVKKTVSSDAQNDAKPILRGELFDIEENSITAVTTDQFRLSVSKKEFNNESGKNFSMVIPGKTLSDVIKIIKQDDTDIVINCAHTHVLFEFDNVKVTSNLLAGEFSNYKNVMPKNFKTEVTLNTAELKKVLERASVLTNEKIKNPLKLSIEEETVVFSCRTPDGMSFLDETFAKINGEKFEIGFNDKFLLDVINVIEEEEITIYMNSPVSPACIRPVGNENDIFLISPIKIRNNDN